MKGQRKRTTKPEDVLRIINEQCFRPAVRQWFHQPAHIRDFVLKRLGNLTETGVSKYVRDAVRPRNHFKMLCPACPLFDLCPHIRVTSSADDWKKLRIQLCRSCSGYIVDEYPPAYGRYFSEQDWPNSGCPALFPAPKEDKEPAPCQHLIFFPKTFDLDEYLKTHGATQKLIYKNYFMNYYPFSYEDPPDAEDWEWAGI